MGVLLAGFLFTDVSSVDVLLADISSANVLMDTKT